jgi:hypothetical protein
VRPATSVKERSWKSTAVEREIVRLFVEAGPEAVPSAVHYTVFLAARAAFGARRFLASENAAARGRFPRRIRCNPSNEATPVRAGNPPDDSQFPLGKRELRLPRRQGKDS